MEERLKLREEVPRLGLQATIRGRTVREIALEVIELASAGLAARAVSTPQATTKPVSWRHYRRLLKARITPAERKLKLYSDEWGGSVDPCFPNVLIESTQGTHRSTGLPTHGHVHCLALERHG